MFDIGFWELLVIGVVLLLVMGPERLPEVAKQAAFFIRKARQGMYRLRTEMQDEIDDTPFSDLEAAKREMDNFKNDIKQFGRDLADAAEQNVGGETSEDKLGVNDAASEPTDVEMKELKNTTKQTEGVDNSEPSMTLKQD